MNKEFEDGEKWLVVDNWLIISEGVTEETQLFLPSINTIHILDVTDDWVTLSISVIGEKPYVMQRRKDRGNELAAFIRKAKNAKSS